MSELISTVSNAPGRLIFWCPGCKSTHQVDDKIWTYNDNAEKPTLSPSVLARSARRKPGEWRCHFYMRDGKLEYLADCTHDLAGQTVDMIALDDV